MGSDPDHGNEFECLANRGGQDLAVAEEFVKKDCS